MQMGSLFPAHTAGLATDVPLGRNGMRLGGMLSKYWYDRACDALERAERELESGILEGAARSCYIAMCSAGQALVKSMGGRDIYHWRGRFSQALWRKYERAARESEAGFIRELRQENGEVPPEPYMEEHFVDTFNEEPGFGDCYGDGRTVRRREVAGLCVAARDFLGRVLELAAMTIQDRATASPGS
jgi:HEPN domain-containing protein